MSKKKKVRKKSSFASRRAASRRPLLSMAMMVKNEEDFLEDALNSAKGWCDELVVVDTGSTDRTVEIAQDLGAKVSHFEWCDSFSAARNETIRRATGRWIAVLDADERFQGPNPAGIRQHLKASAVYPFEGLMVNVINTRLNGSPISSFFSIRFFPNDPRLGYTGVVHNRFGAMNPDDPKVLGTRYLGLEVLHLGYDPDLYVARQKAARSLPLILKTVREQPNNLQFRFYLGREYLLLGRAEPAIEALEHAVNGMCSGQYAGSLQEATLVLMQAYDAAGPEFAVRALSVAERVLAVVGDNADLWHRVGLARQAAGDRSGAVVALERSLAGLDQQVQEGQSQIAHGIWAIHERLGGLYWALQRYAESYQAYLKALPGKPQGGAGWPVMLNSLCALAIELGDRAQTPMLLDRLLACADAPVDMLCFEVNRRIAAGEVHAARALCEHASALRPTIVSSSEFAALSARLGGI